MHDVSANRRGILLMVAGSAVFAANDAGSKLASTYIPVSEFIAIRGLLAALILAVILGLRGQLHGLRHAFDRLVLMRGATEAVSAFLYITALSMIGLADASSIMQVAPLVTMAAAALIIGQKIGWRRWGAVVTGFVGVMLVIKPGPGTFQMAALLPLACAFLISFRDFTTGRIAAHVPTLVVATVTALFGMLVGLIGSDFGSWRTLGVEAFAVTLFGAATMVCGHMLVISAFRSADPTIVAPFRYANVPFAVAYGALIFGMRPDLIAAAGMVLIVMAGIYTLRTQIRPLRRNEPSLEPAE